MIQKSLSAQGLRLRQIAKALARTIKNPTMELAHDSPWELLVATILSAQCTDQRVNQVTPALFRRYPRPAELAVAKVPELEGLIHSTGFFKNKAKHLIASSKVLTRDYSEQLPQTMKELLLLPGVGRKTANVILGNAFNQPSIVVDTHVSRVAKRLGLSRASTPTRIEHDLQALTPIAQWTIVSQRLLLHGRYVCLARKPQCLRCTIHKYCPWPTKGSQ